MNLSQGVAYSLSGNQCVLPFAQMGRNSGCRECSSKSSPCRSLHSSWPPNSIVVLLQDAPVRKRRTEPRPAEQVLAWEENSLSILRVKRKRYASMSFQYSFDSQPSVYSPSPSTSIPFSIPSRRLRKFLSPSIVPFHHFHLPLCLLPFFILHSLSSFNSIYLFFFLILFLPLLCPHAQHSSSNPPSLSFSPSSSHPSFLPF